MKLTVLLHIYFASSNLDYSLYDARRAGFETVVISQLVNEGKARAKVLRSCDKWYGVTYQEDKTKVCAAIAEMTAKGTYPDNLWED